MGVGAGAANMNADAVVDAVDAVDVGIGVGVGVGGANDIDCCYCGYLDNEVYESGARAHCYDDVSVLEGEKCPPEDVAGFGEAREQMQVQVG